MRPAHSKLSRTVLATLVIAASLVGIAAAAGPEALPQSQSVLTYHGGMNRSGNYVMPGLTWERAHGMHPDPAFDGRIEGHVYAQPLFWQSPKTGRQLLLVATEDDVVYALDAHSGKVAWQGRWDTRSTTRLCPAGISVRWGSPELRSSTRSKAPSTSTRWSIRRTQVRNT